MHKALFLDRDGVINIDFGYVSSPDRFEYIDGIFTLCRSAVSKGYLLIVITNQAGIGRGLYSENDFNELTRVMEMRFKTEGCAITAVYHCPFHPEFGIGKYKVESFYRKPNPGMILDAIEDHNISAEKSMLVGDKLSDIEAGMAANINRCILFDSQNEFNYDNKVLHLVDVIKFLE
jgi:D-glycero-D-manno-heptose 1,7-bisphosphate phosphatase